MTTWEFCIIEKTQTRQQVEGKSPAYYKYVAYSFSSFPSTGAFAESHEFPWYQEAAEPHLHWFIASLMKEGWEPMPVTIVTGDETKTISEVKWYFKRAGSAESIAEHEKKKK